MNEVKKERMFELLTDKTLFGLDGQGLVELSGLKKQFPDLENDVSFELAAAKINLTGLDTREPLPANLRARIISAAEVFFSESETSPNVVAFPVKSREVAAPSMGGAFENYREPKQPFWQWLGWGVAALACVALAVNLWTSSALPSPPEVVKTPPIQTPMPELTATQKREQLMTSAQDVVQINWTSAPTDEKQILGDVVWSNDRQAGYMRFRGLPPNDPNLESYQLWIVDETQSPTTPISGGVFDVSAGGEAIVPINAQIKVRKPKVFAVTKEKPGGVVVSKQKEFMAVAKI